MVEWPDGRRLSESTAILTYLAEGTPYLPSDSWQRAQILQWQSFEQYSHEPYVAVLRWWHYNGMVKERPQELPAKIENSYHALSVMELHLQQNDFFSETYSVADVSLYAFTHVAHEGRLSLDDYPAVRAWLARVENRGHFGQDGRELSRLAFV